MISNAKKTLCRAFMAGAITSAIAPQLLTLGLLTAELFSTAARDAQLAFTGFLFSFFAILPMLLFFIAAEACEENRY